MPRLSQKKMKPLFWGINGAEETLNYLTLNAGLFVQTNDVIKQITFINSRNNQYDTTLLAFLYKNYHFV